MAIDGKCGIRFVAGQHLIDRRACDPQRRVVEGTLGEYRRVSRGVQQKIAIAQRHVQSFGKPQYHVAARLRPPGLQKTEMPRRDFCVERQLKLAQPAVLPPLAQQIADGSDRG